MALTEQIKISEQTKSILDELKPYKSTTYDEVICDLIEKAKKYDYEKFLNMQE